MTTFYVKRTTQAKRAASLRAAADRMGADERRARALRVWETRRARGT
jgi:acyl-CoA reductase-like NAD-dependent aldehyde dehydrogenase